jgi:hypothetical protein
MFHVRYYLNCILFRTRAVACLSRMTQDCSWSIAKGRKPHLPARLRRVVFTICQVKIYCSCLNYFPPRLSNAVIEFSCFYCDIIYFCWTFISVFKNPSLIFYK